MVITAHVADESPECERYVTYNYCEVQPEYMKKHCPVSCGETLVCARGYKVDGKMCAGETVLKGGGRDIAW